MRCIDVRRMARPRKEHHRLPFEPQFPLSPGLLISGGMLIPGNIPNIISAGKLGITSSEWAKLGVPFGLVLNAIYFVVVFVLNINPVIPMH